MPLSLCQVTLRKINFLLAAKYSLLKMHMPNKCIWTLPTSSKQSLTFASVVSTVAFSYSAYFRLYCPGHSVVRAVGTKRSIDPEEQHCDLPCSVAETTRYPSGGMPL